MGGVLCRAFLFGIIDIKNGVSTHFRTECFVVSFFFPKFAEINNHKNKTTMFGIGTQEILIIALIILLLFGGRKIPELMRGLGKGIKSFKDGMKEVDDEVKDLNDKKEDADKK